ncbi:putative histidinol dehydrogenase (but probably not) [hydrothermal vent metagenome]|uniref:Putative histidinol dehydrogenase (But probably not) n=1 Tax=hydrothermal vent metagenome TaxID=652676 RepID=A0A3B0RQ47_9ZZZZ
MAITYLKKARKTPQTGEDETRFVVEKMLTEIEAYGEVAVLRYAEQLDGYTRPVVVSSEQIEQAAAQVSTQLKEDIQFSLDRVRKFAEAQRDSINEFELELLPGLWAGQKLIPIQTAGCYIPGGRYAHVASAIMSIATARVAGVEDIVACSPPKGNAGLDPAIVYAMNLCGADTILALGGVQAIAAMAFGLFTGKPANILVGPGNRFVAEAKRVLFGRVGIDLFAGPTEIAIIADSGADVAIVVEDMISQAEHGPDSPAWLITTSRKLAKDVLASIDQRINDLPEIARQAAQSAWKDYGEVVLCESDEEAATVSDEYAAEHLQIQTGKNDWYLKRLKNYGSLFVGEETTVTYGDKCSGTNHILPTKGAAKYTGGLSVHKFMKVVTTQRMTQQANHPVGQVAARISRLEKMEAHARSADIRLKKYFPDETFNTGGS